VTFFRSIGSSLGGAIFGTILITRLTHYIHQALPQAGSVAATAISSGVANIPDAVRPQILQAYVSSFRDLFLFAVPFTIATFVVALFLKEAPLRETTRDTVEAESFEKA
jgi:hypothetical protein